MGVDPRVALVIGVNDYDESCISPLKNAVADARSIKELLCDEGGFCEVLLCLNPTRLELMDKLLEFKELVEEKSNCIAVLFYSGNELLMRGRSIYFWSCPQQWR